MQTFKSFCGVTVLLVFVTIVRGEYSNVGHNIITDGQLFYSVYPDPGTQNWPFPFYTPNPGLTNWVRYDPPLFYGSSIPKWSVEFGFDNYELNVVQQNLIIYFDVASKITNGAGPRAIGLAWADQIKDTIKPWQTNDYALVYDYNLRLEYVEPSLVLHSSLPNQFPLLLYRDSAFQLHSSYLSNDGLRLAGAPTTLLQPSLDWEGGELRHPKGFYKDGLLYIMYLSRDGSVGVARSREPLGPYEKHVLPVGKIAQQQVKNFKSLSQQQLLWDNDGWPYIPEN